MRILEKIKSRFTRDGLKAPARWVAAASFTIAHVVALTFVLQIKSQDANLLQLLGWIVPALVVFPGVITMTLLPHGWKRWYRWAALLGLVMMFLEVMTNPNVVVLFGETWMLHRAWVTERTVPVKDLFRRGKPQEPLSAPGRKPKGSRRPKTA